MRFGRVSLRSTACRLARQLLPACRPGAFLFGKPAAIPQPVRGEGCNLVGNRWRGETFPPLQDLRRDLLPRAADRAPRLSSRRGARPFQELLA
jgi:hypothetical protein